jgi:cysteinyl-tRNA synthetase
MLSAHYRSPINFSDELIEQAKNGLDRMYNCLDNLKHHEKTAVERETVTEIEMSLEAALNNYKQKFIDAMEDDLNTADAISAIFEMVKEINTIVKADSNISKSAITFAYGMLKEFGGILGLLKKGQEASLEADVEELISQRQQARKDKNWKEADNIRDKLKEMGIVLEDTPQGIKWKKV